MKKHVNDPDSHLWEVIDVDTNKIIRGVQWADDKTGELERFIFKNEEKDELLIVDGNVCPVKEKRNIKLIKK